MGVTRKDAHGKDKLCSRVEQGGLSCAGDGRKRQEKKRETENWEVVMLKTKRLEMQLLNARKRGISRALQVPGRAVGWG